MLPTDRDSPLLIRRIVLDGETVILDGHEAAPARPVGTSARRCMTAMCVNRSIYGGWETSCACG